MDIFNFCWITFLNEAKRFNIPLDKIKYDIATYDLDFDVTENRLAFIYKLSTFNILFIEKCLKMLKDDCQEGYKIVKTLCKRKNLEICSVSNGPVTDITGLLHAFLKFSNPFKGSISLNVINKYDSWRSLLKMTYGEENAHYMPYNVADTSLRNSKFIHCDISNSISPEAESCLKHSDIILMVRAFSHKIDNEKFSLILLNILGSMKSGALVFFVDSQRKCQKFVKINNCGIFLFGPQQVELHNVPINETVCEIVGAKPIQSGVACFALWQKTELCVKAFSNNNENLNVTSKSINSISDVCSVSWEKAIRKKISVEFDNEQSVSSSSSNNLSFCKSELPSHINLTSLKNRNYALNNKTSASNEDAAMSVIMRCENLISRLEELVKSISQRMQETEKCCNSPKCEMLVHYKNSCCFQNCYEKLFHYTCCCSQNTCCPKRISCNCTISSFPGVNTCHCHTGLICSTKSDTIFNMQTPYIIFSSQDP